jgi:hypothetical protein
MRKVRIFEHISLDGVISPGAPGEYGDAYANGGWTAPYRIPAGLALVLEAQGESFEDPTLELHDGNAGHADLRTVFILQVSAF